jgi:hypothetical protein
VIFPQSSDASSLLLAAPSYRDVASTAHIEKRRLRRGLSHCKKRLDDVFVIPVVNTLV